MRSTSCTTKRILHNHLIHGITVVVFGLTGQLGQAQDSKAAPLSLNDCISLGMEHQPTLAAARASLSAANSSYRSLNNMRMVRLVSAEVRVRRQQACLGMDIANAGLDQVVWETRYAITRNFYSILYAREQETLVKGLLKKLQDARDKAKKLVDIGDPKLKVTKLDVDVLVINIELIEAKKVKASVGIEKATAALREAMGVDRKFPLNIEGTLPAVVERLDRDELIDMGLARRGEITQAQTALEVSALEVRAQGKKFGMKGATFGGGSDVHAKPVPQGVANGDYRPGAIGLEVPTMLAGRKSDRVNQARDIEARAGAVVDKTRNLIALEVEASFLKWKEAHGEVSSFEKTIKLAGEVAKVVENRFNNGAVTGEDLLRARGLVEQTQANLNEARYNHALALAALERVTAGGYRIGDQHK